ncbi:MAG: RluA family pseudouridine synthase [Nitrospinaceae bacterium]
MHRLEFEIDPPCARKRLDIYLTEVQGDISRTFIQKLIGQGLVRVNGQLSKPKYQVRAGDEVTLTVPDPVPLELIPEPIPLQVVYEDPHLLVIDKPSGMVVHPAPGHPQGTLVHALLHHCRDLRGIGGVERPGIVHRLDKDTSGLILAAKTDKALLSLQQQFQDRGVRKTYLALARGRLQPTSGVISSAIARHPGHRKKMAARPGGRSAETAYEVVRHLAGYDFVRLFPKTGRTHQIRVHLASLGHPVLSDPLYGGRSSRQDPAPPRLALHAHRLGLAHPEGGQWMEFESPWPPDLAAWIPD